MSIVVVSSTAPKEEVVTEKDEKETESTEENTEETETDQEEPAEVAAAEDKGEDGDQEESKDQAEEKPKKLTGYKKKFVRLQMELQQKQQEIEQLRQQTSKKQEDDVKVDVSTKPNPDEFESTAEYLEKLADWKIEQKLAKEREEKQKEQLKTEAQKVTETYNKRLNEFKKTQKGFDEAVENFIDEVGDVQFSVALDTLIKESDLGPQVLFELVKNPDDFERINSLGALAAAREFGKIEARINLPKSKEVKKISTASAPLKPLNTGKGTAKKTIFTPGLSQAEYEELRREQKKAQQRA
jgi:hypothetical protein